MEVHEPKNQSFDSQKDTKKYSDECMFFVGGNKNKKLNIDPKNQKKYANMFNDDDDPIEEPPKEEPKLVIEDEEDSFEKIIAAKKNTSAFRMKHSRKRTLDESTVEPIVASKP